MAVHTLPTVLQDLPDPALPTGDDTEPPAPGGWMALAERIGYPFARPSLLRVALTLGSWANEHPDAGWPSNACMEFFGDAVLDLVAADTLWRRFPELAEGVLTRLRSALVAEVALAEAAQRLDLGHHLYLGRGDARRGARVHRGTLADAMEAVIGAVFLDARTAGADGLTAAASVFERVFQSAVAALDPEDVLDPKSRLQQWAQGRYRVTPTYVRVGNPPAAHDPDPVWMARVELRFADDSVLTLGEGQGRTLKIAERHAARSALEARDRTKTCPDDDAPAT